MIFKRRIKMVKPPKQPKPTEDVLLSGYMDFNK